MVVVVHYDVSPIAITWLKVIVVELHEIVVFFNFAKPDRIC